MAGCCEHACGSAAVSPVWRRALWIALGVNAVMFAVEMGSGIASGSSSLQADALDFLGDAANYAISLGVAGLALQWRARAALVKGASLALLGLVVAVTTFWHATHGTLPEARVMGAVGVTALVANGVVAVMLFGFRGGDANMRSAWICSRNDAIGNVAVMLAAAGVFGTGTGWPDIVVAAVMSGLALWGGLEIVRHAVRDLAAARDARPFPAE
jgi:Co/Zn/Cd efflux system component